MKQNVACGKCKVCLHKSKASIDFALAEKESYDSIAERFQVSKATVSRYRTGCFDEALLADGERRRAERAKVASRATEQYALAVREGVARSDQSAIELAKVELAHASELADLSQRVVKALASRAFNDDGTIQDPNDSERLFQVMAGIKTAVEARGGGSRAWLEMVAKLNGELAPSGQVTIQIRNEVAMVVQRVGEANGRWLAEDVPAALQAGLEECGFSDDGNLAKVKAVLMRHLAGARGALKERMAGELPAGGGT